jgi:hypothetical protein
MSDFRSEKVRGAHLRRPARSRSRFGSGHFDQSSEQRFRLRSWCNILDHLSATEAWVGGQAFVRRRVLPADLPRFRKLDRVRKYPRDRDISDRAPGCEQEHVHAEFDDVSGAAFHRLGSGLPHSVQTGLAPTG